MRELAIEAYGNRAGGGVFR